LIQEEERKLPRHGSSDPNRGVFGVERRRADGNIFIEEDRTKVAGRENKGKGQRTVARRREAGYFDDHEGTTTA